MSYICDHNPSTSQTDGRTTLRSQDRASHYTVHRTIKKLRIQLRIVRSCSDASACGLKSAVSAKSSAAISTCYVDYTEIFQWPSVGSEWESCRWGLYGDVLMDPRSDVRSLRNAIVSRIMLALSSWLVMSNVKQEGQGQAEVIVNNTAKIKPPRSYKGDCEARSL